MAKQASWILLLKGRKIAYEDGCTLSIQPSFWRHSSLWRHRSLLWRHCWAVLMAACTQALIFIGGLVTSTGSGLAVPDWPLSYGMLMPPMVGGVFYEHGHRMVAAFVGLMTLIFAIWTAFTEQSVLIKRLAWFALALVTTQGILGGLTVLFLLPTFISVTHACLAQIFFCTTITLAYLTSIDGRQCEPIALARSLRVPAALVTAIVFIQLLLGAIMRHLHAGLAIPDFPLFSGRLLPPLHDLKVLIHFTHRSWALLVLGAVLWLYRKTRQSQDRSFYRTGTTALILTLIQLGLGVVTILSRRAVLPTTAHVAIGAAILGTTWLVTLRAFRHSRHI